MDSGTLRLAYLPPSSFVHPIVARLNSAKSPVLQTLRTEWQGSEVSDLGISVSTKLAMLSQLGHRLFASFSPLIESVRGANIPELLSRGAGLVVEDRIAPYKVLLEVDAFIYEFRSFYEILGKFITALFSRIGRPVKETDILARLKGRGIDMSWSRELQEHRKVFFHERAPWIAVEVKSAEALDFEFVILMHPGAEPSDPDQAVSLKRLNAIYSGMALSLREIQGWILEEMDRIERPAT